MKTNAAIVTLLLIGLAFPVVTWSKGVTVKITATGKSLPEILVVTDRDVVEQFSIWTGPNSHMTYTDGTVETDYRNTYVDFVAGPIEEPSSENLRFEVRFFIAAVREDQPHEQSYTVIYSFGPTSDSGYFYLPEGNPFIYHGVEGNWFHSSNKWEKFMRPLIEQVTEEQYEIGT